MTVIELLRIVPSTFAFTYLLRWQTVQEFIERPHLKGFMLKCMQDDGNIGGQTNPNLMNRCAKLG